MGFEVNKDGARICQQIIADEARQNPRGLAEAALVMMGPDAERVVLEAIRVGRLWQYGFSASAPLYRHGRI